MKFTENLRHVEPKVRRGRFVPTPGTEQGQF